MTPTVEIFVLIYDDADIATRAIRSVLVQTYRNFRLTILDNGSTDRAPNFCNLFREDSRVRIVPNERNIRSFMPAHHLKNSDADYISLLFADDFYEPQRLEVMLSQIGGASAIFANNRYIDEHEQAVRAPIHIATVSDISSLTPNGHLRQFYLAGNSLHPCAMLVRTDAYRRLGGFPGHFHRLGDMYFFAKLLSREAVKIIPDELQTITVWSDLRNESAQNVSNVVPSALESAFFCELYAEEPILSRLEEIFSSELDRPKLETDAERLWYLGMVTAFRADFWKMSFAFKCLYRALELDESRINAAVINASGMTPSEYVAFLAERVALPPTFVQSPPLTLRNYLRQFGVLRSVYNIMQRFPAGVRALLSINSSNPMKAISPCQ